MQRLDCARCGTLWCKQAKLGLQHRGVTNIYSGWLAAPRLTAAIANFDMPRREVRGAVKMWILHTCLLT